MRVTQINPENWTYSSYISEQLRAFITFGATPGLDEEPIFEYHVTLLTIEDTKEVFQKSFLDLGDAIDAINKNYGHWEFTQENVTPRSESSCSTCQAH